MQENNIFTDLIHVLCAEWTIDCPSLDPNVVVGAPHRRGDEGGVATEFSYQG